MNLNLFLFFIVTSYGQFTKIKITKPPKPKEILPQKPIIILPMIIKKHPPTKKMTIYKVGPDYDPNFRGQKPFYQNPLFSNRIVGRKMMKGKRQLNNNFIFQNEQPDFYDQEFQKEYETQNDKIVWDQELQSVANNVEIQKFKDYMISLNEKIENNNSLIQKELEELNFQTVKFKEKYFYMLKRLENH